MPRVARLCLCLCVRYLSFSSSRYLDEPPGRTLKIDILCVQKFVCLYYCCIYYGRQVKTIRKDRIFRRRAGWLSYILFNVYK